MPTVCEPWPGKSSAIFFGIAAILEISGAMKRVRFFAALRMTNL
jgi:hypothetical protein